MNEAEPANSTDFSAFYEPQTSLPMMKSKDDMPPYPPPAQELPWALIVIGALALLLVLLVVVRRLRR